MDPTGRYSLRSVNTYFAIISAELVADSNVEVLVFSEDWGWHVQGDLHEHMVKGWTQWGLDAPTPILVASAFMGGGRRGRAY